MIRTKDLHMEQRLRDIEDEEEKSLQREYNLNFKRIKKNERNVKRKSNKGREV